MDKVPDEEHDRWVARLRELARSDAAELVPDPAFEVFGVADPGLQPVALADCQRADGQWESIGLAYGDWTAPGGPFVSVTTSTLVAEEPRGHDAGLLRLIDGERNRIAEYAGIDEADPAEPPDYSEASLAVGGQPVRVRRGRHGASGATDKSGRSGGNNCRAARCRRRAFARRCFTISCGIRFISASSLHFGWRPS